MNVHYDRSLTATNSLRFHTNIHTYITTNIQINNYRAAAERPDMMKIEKNGYMYKKNRKKL